MQRPLLVQIPQEENRVITTITTRILRNKKQKQISQDSRKVETFQLLIYIGRMDCVIFKLAVGAPEYETHQQLSTTHDWPSASAAKTSKQPNRQAATVNKLRVSNSTALLLIYPLNPLLDVNSGFTKPR